MTGRARRLTVVAAAVVALVAAGSVGAIVRATVFRVQSNQYAYLAGTNNVYCRSFIQQWTPPSANTLSFTCYFLKAGATSVSSGYDADINRHGVTVDRYIDRRGKVFKQFENPGKNPPKQPGQTITIPSALTRTVPGSP